ncbi:MAG: MerR family transcriptional regulator [Candidatus Omnitrophota bacterium]
MIAGKKKQAGHFEEVEIDEDMPVYTTGVVCKILGIPVWTLKQLDKEGIVSPPRESEGQSRLYSKRQLKKVQHCWVYMKQHSVKIPGLKVILRMEKKKGE